MKLNIVSVRNNWAPSGLLKAEYSPKQEVELSRCLEKAMSHMLALDADDDLPDNVGDFVITAIVEIYEMMTIRRFIPLEADIKILANNLTMDEHKIDVEKMTELAIERVEELYMDKKDFFRQAELDMVIRDKITLDYLKEYGTRE